MVAAIAAGAGAVLPQLLPYLPILGKFALGLLPANASAVVGKVVTFAKQGIGLARPVLDTLDAIKGGNDGAESADITLDQMNVAIAALNAPGAYEEAYERATKPAA